MTFDPASITGNWNYPTKMIVGPGRIAALAEACRSQGMTRMDQVVHDIVSDIVGFTMNDATLYTTTS